MIVRRRRPRLASRLRRLFGRLPDRGMPGSLDRQRLVHEINKERTRADRRNIPFSLVRFDGQHHRLDAEQLIKIAAHFRRRLRITDEYGLLDDLLTVLLPDTPARGAFLVACHLCDLAQENGVALIAQVETYPADSDQDGGVGMDSGLGADSALDDQPAGACESTALPSGPGSAARILAVPLSFSRPNPLWKRAMDIAGSSLGLLVFSPLLLLACIAIKLGSSGPVIFTQWREGRGGQLFRIYKFRTMSVDAELDQAPLRQISEQDGPAFKLKDDPRLTMVGRYLRKSCIDELPQLLNVLKGEMSLVGPRPLPAAESRQCNVWQRRRLDVLPGLTCIWQVSGGRVLPFDRWMRMDLEYLERFGFWCDFRLMLRTMLVALTLRGSV